MKENLTITVDTDDEDLGIGATMDSYRPLLSQPLVKLRIAEEMTAIFQHKTQVSRQMLEKWTPRIRTDSTVLPSTRMFMAFLIAAKRIEKDETARNTDRSATERKSAINLRDEGTGRRKR